MRITSVALRASASALAPSSPISISHSPNSCNVLLACCFSNTVLNTHEQKMICKRVFLYTTVSCKNRAPQEPKPWYKCCFISSSSFEPSHSTKRTTFARNVQSETRTELQDATQRKDFAIPRSCCSTLLISHPSFAKTLDIAALTETATHVPTTKQHCHYRKFAEPAAWTLTFLLGTWLSVRL